MMRLLLIAMLLVLPGCLQRRIRVTSEPPGAVVWVNDTEIGRTPAETTFTFFGDYDVRLELDGYEPVHEMRRARAPLHEYPGPDLVAAALPVKFKTLIEWHFDLAPSLEASLSPEQLEPEMIERARRLRRQTEGLDAPIPPKPDDEPASPVDGGL
ncbi:MAG: PEGA domain-containing protein [Leptolyngbya sp. PLA3]|nr:MAG: PEGA domain-containing protein [Cyanobacteria bacterium CYA]MCE7967715.1 PEGA domain-containing protein [Leptolyngbya sp. PL-A3]